MSEQWLPSASDQEDMRHWSKESELLTGEVDKELITLRTRVAELERCVKDTVDLYQAKLDERAKQLATVTAERDDLRDKCDPSFLTAPILRLTDGVVTIQWQEGARGAVVVRELIDQWIETRNQLAARAYTWTTARPTVAGGYWVRHAADDEPFVAMVDEFGCVGTYRKPLEECDGWEFAGPILGPEETTR